MLLLAGRNASAFVCGPAPMPDALPDVLVAARAAVMAAGDGVRELKRLEVSPQDSRFADALAALQARS